jgi:hypothetical protein
MFYQNKQDTLHQYNLKFKDLFDALEHYGAELGTDIGLIKDIAERNGKKNVEGLNQSHNLSAEDIRGNETLSNTMEKNLLDQVVSGAKFFYDNSRKAITAGEYMSNGISAISSYMDKMKGGNQLGN